MPIDLNPNPDRAGHATSIMGEVHQDAGLEALMTSAAQFGLGAAAAASILGDVRSALSEWQSAALAHGVKPAECDLMRDAFARVEH